MTWSCSRDVIMSSLCGMFWQSGVTCSYIRFARNPGESAAGIPDLYHKILAIMCSFRQPQVFTLWLGAVASGLTPIILNRVERGRPLLDPHAFSWTGSPQFFMDIPGSGPYICQKSADDVRRADVWRLLYLSLVVEDDLCYNSLSFTPWALFAEHHCA
jgi:hypothetical protein